MFYLYCSSDLLYSFLGFADAFMYDIGTVMRDI